MTTSNFIPLFSYTTTQCYLDINLYTNTNNMTQGQIDILLLCQMNDIDKRKRQFNSFPNDGQQNNSFCR